MIIGITGGVGSGKSEVLKLFKTEYDAYIIELDTVAKELMQKGGAAYEDVVSKFPKTADDNGINRGMLSEIVFSDRDKLAVLNGIVHPMVKDEIKKRIAKVKAENKDAVIVIEAALLIEDGYRNICDSIWNIHCDTAIRKKRLEESRGYSKEKTEGIISNQLSQDEFKKYTDYTIDNSGRIEDTLKQIKKIMERGIKMIKKVSTDKAPAAIGPYSQAVIVNGIVYTSGQIPINPATGEIEECDIAGQAEQVMKNLGEVLKEAGASYKSAIKTVCFLSNMADFAAFNSVYENILLKNRQEAAWV